MRTASELLDGDAATMLVTALPVGLWFLWLAISGAWNDWRNRER